MPTGLTSAIRQTMKMRSTKKAAFTNLCWKRHLMNQVHQTRIIIEGVFLAGWSMWEAAKELWLWYNPISLFSYLI